MQKIRFYFPDMVFGAIDGIVTTFVVIAGVYGASLAPALMLILGVANLFADGFSMGVSSYVASDSRQVAYETRGQARVSGLVTFVSFVIAGSIPLLPIVYYFAQNKPVNDQAYLISFLMSLVAFLALGIAKGLATKTSVWKTGIATLLIGSTASLIAFTIGRAMEHLV